MAVSEDLRAVFCPLITVDQALGASLFPITSHWHKLALLFVLRIQNLYRYNLRIMHRVGIKNPEYMAVLTQVVHALLSELRHPKLSPPTADDLLSWFHGIHKEEIEAAMERVSQQTKPMGDAASAT